ncbi:MAG: glycosyltransferase family 9 protein [Bacteroidales bacterium]|nr:glycosyltransferase family 9 protein [Bacteroidales bacterium]
MVKKFLVIQTASIGDVILATPVLEKLHAFFPEAQIDVLLKKGNESLFEAHPFISKLLIWDKSHKKYKNLLGLLFAIRDENYDALINIQRFATSGLLTAFSGAEYKAGFNKNPFSIFFNKRVRHTIKQGNKHETERNLELIKDLTDETNYPVRLYPTQADEAMMSQYKTVKYITISPASLWFTKQYPAEKWVEFINEIDPAYRIYFLGSKNDAEICERIISESSYNNSMNLAGKLRFLESASLMKNAIMNFVNDSAPMHLASAVNAPVTAIFCSTVPAFGFGPLSEKSHVVETRLPLDCRPCGLHGFNKCPERHFKCALTIDKKELLNQLK